MTFALWAASAYCGLAVVLHLTSIAMAAVRCRAPRRHLPPPPAPPAVTIIRPVCGFDNFVDVTLASSFVLDYPRYEVLFCAASARDPIVPLVRALIAAHPGVAAALLIGDERISDNPKLNNVLKGWRAAANDLVVMVDSNVLMPPDYIQRLLAAWRPGTGMVSAPPVGSHARGFWAGLECAFLNTYQARWQYAADTLGMGFAQGKTLVYRKSEIEALGGLDALAGEAAEDAASTKLMRSCRRRVRLVDSPFRQPLGIRTGRDVWQRQVRWARLRRDSFPGYYALEILSGALLPLAAAGVAAHSAGLPVITAVVLLVALWYGAEMLLAAVAGWPVPLLFPMHAALRDLLLPALWVEGWRGRPFMWRGQAMTVDQGRAAAHR